MKKSATLISGILTIVLFLFIAFVSIFQLAGVFNIQSILELIENIDLLVSIMTVVIALFIDIPLSFATSLLGEIPNSELIIKILSITLTAFSLFMIFWGIKEILISRKDDESFARCKKTCGFMMFTKFMFFAFLAASVVLFFINENYKGLWSLIILILNLMTGKSVENLIMYALIGSAVYALIIFLLPTINFAIASKKFNSGYSQGGDGQNYQDAQNTNYNNPNGQAYASQSTMQANMPPIPGYQPQYNTQPQPAPQPQPTTQNVAPQPQQQVAPQPAPQPQPVYATSEPQPSVQAQFNPQVQAEEALRASSITPGQNGVPLNITQKGIEGLERLERLRASGMLTEENYQAMRLKIFNTDIS